MSRTAGRPLSITVIALLMLLGGLWELCSWGAGNGTMARVVSIAFGLGNLALSWGLWQLKPWARVTAIGYQLLSFLWLLILLGSPQVAQLAEQARTQNHLSAEAAAPIVAAVKAVALAIGAATCLVPAWFLVKRKAAFGGPAGADAPPA